MHNELLEGKELVIIFYYSIIILILFLRQKICCPICRRNIFILYKNFDENNLRNEEKAINYKEVENEICHYNYLFSNQRRSVNLKKIVILGKIYFHF